MPRDKKSIHRATSDVEDEEVSDTEIVEQQPEKPLSSPTSEAEVKDLIQERKKFLKEAILKRTLALRQQRERKNCQVKSTKS